MAYTTGPQPLGPSSEQQRKKQVDDLLARADGSMSAETLAEHVRKAMNGGSLPAAPKQDKPPLPFDWTDQILQAVRAGEMRRQQTGRTRASAFSLLGGA